MFYVDLHTHSKASPDGSLDVADYYNMACQQGENIDYVLAVTDHNTIDYALDIKQAIGERIIVGEEISTSDGHVIGLFMSEHVEAGQSATDTANQIHDQNALVYVPHPFDLRDHGVGGKVLGRMVKRGDIDIIEGWNGRLKYPGPGYLARRWARARDIPMAASSDAHGWHGWGRTYTRLEELPTRDNLVEQLRAAGEEAMRTGHVGLGLAYPAINRRRNRQPND